MTKASAAMIQAMVWYRPEDWDALMKIFTDTHLIPPTYEEWEKRAEQNRQAVKADGDVVMKVYVDPVTFPAWCEKKGMAPDAEARTTFAIEVVTKQQFGDKV